MNLLRQKIDSLSQRVSAHVNAKRAENVVEICENGNVNFKGNFDYVASNTAAKFHADNSRIRLIMGAIRSGKSTASCAEIIRRAVQMPVCKDGVRRCVACVIRNTYPQLKTTTVRTWQNWWGALGDVHSNFASPISFRHTFEDARGKIELLVWFLALDTTADVGKLLSLELSFAYINEMREIPHGIFEHLCGRVGQYPSRNMLKNPAEQGWYGIFADTNPPDRDHWLYKVFEENCPSDYKLFRQPPALIKDKNDVWQENPLAENTANLPANYYKDLLSGASEEFIKVYILGEYGLVFDGRGVFANYNDDIHSVENLQSSGGELYLGWDGGLTPACVLAELVGNRINVLKEWKTERMYFDELISVVQPYLFQYYRGKTFKSIADPALSLDCLVSLENAGIPTTKALTNEIEPRISAVNNFLGRLSGGQPCLQVSRTECPVLRKGFVGKYCYRRMQVIGEEKFRDVPDKSHPYSDVQDCLQYICLEISALKNKSAYNFDAPQLMFKNAWL